jgi:DivIVA domain-containing protein
VDQDSVDRIRSATFNSSRRGYDTEEVDAYLHDLADWLEGGGAEVEPSEAVRRELDNVGRHTAGLLSAAGEAAGSIRSEAEVDAAEKVDRARIEANATRVDADDYAERIRAEADEYSQAERGKADAYALRMREEAGEQAGKIIADGQSRREALEGVISDLAERRDQLLDELEGIAGSIAGTASRARGETLDAEANGSSFTEAETTEAATVETE